MNTRELRLHHWVLCRKNRVSANNERLGKSEIAAQNHDRIANFHLDAVVCLNDVVSYDPTDTAEKDGKDNPILQQIEHDIEVTARLLRQKIAKENN